ncbi:aminopeptidase [Halobacteriovorax sp. HLS]|uniref:aminopeptidase n=1 Tax=Halobacteriovorax sp. HLS TaxID=2234000 RepID=UPI0013E3BEE3|nr:aminopeptidase [Halobacteriovorax sp. HLS]
MSSLKYLFLLTLISCAKIGYLAEQGSGQLGLLSKARSNELVLSDVRVSKADKEKIKLIEEYKTFFYKYWQKKETSIYSETTILQDEAVTYLVIVSKHNKIEALEECFPVMGCFPYLGFFQKDSAKKYATEQEKKGLVTYIRPVYAYSTLGYFTDTILSSFFIFDEYELADLIFHELFHTIFFVKDEVELNENLADYFAKEMVLEYFKSDVELKDKLRKKDLLSKSLSKQTVEFARAVNLKLTSDPAISKEDSSKLIDKLVEEKLRPKISQVCSEFNVDDNKCYFLKRDWNQASLAAFMTYQNKVDKIKLLRSSTEGDLVHFFDYIENELKLYKNSDKKISFSEWLFKSINK